MIVPNVETSARFYMGVFNTKLHAHSGWVRYFVLFRDLPANRQVGYLAIGDSRGRRTSIGVGAQFYRVLFGKDRTESRLRTVATTYRG